MKTPLPLPTVIVSLPTPPMTVLSPASEVTVSLPPLAFVSTLESARTMRPAALNTRLPLSPSNVSVPTPVVMMSLP